MRKFSFLILFVFVGFQTLSQDELLDLLDDDSLDVEMVSATFKGTRLINGHTVEVRSPHEMDFVISHRFGNINTGDQQLWGLDQSNIRLALEYGMAKNLTIGLGRSSFDRTIDTYLKYQMLQQAMKMPVTMTGFGSMTKNTNRDLDIEKNHRFTYTAQLLIARKFTTNFSFQLSPTFIQRNLVPTNEDSNGLIAVGFGGRQKLTQRLSLNFEYYAQLSDYNSTRQNAIAIGVDIETGGHVFQLHLTNAQQMNEKGFIGETDGNFFDGDVRFGFNISRVFDLHGDTKSWD